MTDTFIAAWATRLRGEIPGIVAILLKGSHARDDAGPHSDIDFDVLVDGDPAKTYPLWVDTDAAGRMRHISVAVQDLTGRLAEGDEPEPWALGLPVRETTRLLWAETPDLREKLDRPWRAHPPAAPEIEDWLEYYGKIRNAAQRGDALGVRQAAQGVGRSTPALLRPLNPRAVATSPRSAIDLALAFPVAPQGYREDLLACLGLTGGATLDALLAADLAGYLRDGTLRRYIASMAAGSH